MLNDQQISNFFQDTTVVIYWRNLSTLNHAPQVKKCSFKLRYVF